MLVDTHQRIHNYLRISLTDACNLRCFYCMPNEEIEVTPKSQLMHRDEIISLAKIFVQQGVNKIRLTGGEPLVRKDVADIITGLGELNIKLTLTTNGILLHKFIDVFKKSGIHSVNISLDTMHAAKYFALTKRDLYEQVKQNIALMLQHGFSVKINMVVMKGINDDEINDFVAFTQKKAVHVRFIEFMPFNGNQWKSDKVFTFQEILDQVAQDFSFIKIKDEINDTTKKYQCYGHEGTFAIISTMTAPFCNTCNRLRLTADGKLKNCLFSSSETDLLTALRNGEDLLPLIHENVLSKKAALGGQLLPDYRNTNTELLNNRSMISIGG